MLQSAASKGHITVTMIVAVPIYTIPATDPQAFTTILANIFFQTVAGILAVITVDDEMAADEYTIIENFSLDRLWMSVQSFCYLLE